MRDSDSGVTDYQWPGQRMPPPVSLRRTSLNRDSVDPGDPEPATDVADRGRSSRYGDIVELGADGFVRVVDLKKAVTTHRAGNKPCCANVEQGIRRSQSPLTQAFAVDERYLCPVALALTVLHPDGVVS